MVKKYKKSKWIHILKKKQDIALFNANNLEILYVDPEVHSLFESFSKPTTPESIISKFKNKSEARLILEELSSKRFIIPIEEDEEKTFQSNLQFSVDKKTKDLGKKSRLNALRLVLTEKCPLQCSYCFVKREQKELKDLDEDTLLKALKMLVSLNKGKDVEVQFFGGEPLLRFDLIKKAVDYLDECLERDEIKKVFLGITTNGILVTPEIAKYFSENNFLVSLSIDGWGEINDITRKFPKGQGSYKYIIKALNLLKQFDCQIGLLLTPSPSNISILDKICEYFIVNLNCNFITVNTPQSFCGSWEIDGKEFSKQVYKMLKVAKKHNAIINTFGSRILYALNNHQPQILSCSKFNENYTATISTDGKVSPCIISWDLGENMIPLEEMSFKGPFRDWKIYKPFTLKNCLNCEAMNLCGGPCPLELYRAKVTGEKIDTERCRFFKDALKWAIWFQ